MAKIIEKIVNICFIIWFREKSKARQKNKAAFTKVEIKVSTPLLICSDIAVSAIFS